MTQASNRPLTARSVLASALLGEDPPELPVSHLVHLAALFGISGNRARVALSRMVAAGEATTDGDGRYRLAGHLLDRLERQNASRRGGMSQWSGGWRVVVVTVSGQGAEERLARRRRLAAARLAELREGVWMRPDNIDLSPDLAGDPGLVVLSASPEGDEKHLAGSLWDLSGWARGAEELERRLDELEPTGPGDLAPGFELSAGVLRHLQADPLLPDLLLPDDWPGSALRKAYDRWDRQYRKVLVSWGRSR
jgi:phenylacetic acid degradation operon negative regulatory protein